MLFGVLPSFPRLSFHFELLGRSFLFTFLLLDSWETPLFVFDLFSFPSVPKGHFFSLAHDYYFFWLAGIWEKKSKKGKGGWDTKKGSCFYFA